MNICDSANEKSANEKAAIMRFLLTSNIRDRFRSLILR